MDVELQILQHLARDAQPTVSVIDEYCSSYKDLFPEVRSYECFKYLHVGIISPIKRKSLPEIAKIVGINSAQSRHHFLAKSPRSIIEIRQRRLSTTLSVLQGEKITVVIDENQTSEIRYVRELIFGKRRKRTYWEITTDPETMPPNSSSYVMTNLQNEASQIKKILGNLYGLRTWIKYGFRPCKQELGWTDYRLTKFEQIEKWWQIIFSAYWMISSLGEVFATLNESHNSSNLNTPSTDIIRNFTRHQQWSTQAGWKTTLNNLRLIIQPLILLWLIVSWIEIFPNRYLLLGFHQLIALMNQFFLTL